MRTTSTSGCFSNSSSKYFSSARRRVNKNPTRIMVTPFQINSVGRVGRCSSDRIETNKFQNNLVIEILLLTYGLDTGFALRDHRLRIKVFESLSLSPDSSSDIRPNQVWTRYSQYIHLPPCVIAQRILSHSNNPTSSPQQGKLQ